MSINSTTVLEKHSRIVLQKDSLVDAYPLSVQIAGEGKIYLGSIWTHEFLVVDSCWRGLVGILETPQRVEDIANKLSQKDPITFCPNEVMCKVQLMILYLAEHHLIRAIDTVPLGESTVKRERPLIPKKLAATLLHPFFIPLYLGLAAFGLIAPLLYPDFRPIPQDFFWSNRLSINVFTYFVISWITVLLHEFAHAVTARAFGISGRFRFSHRLYFLVVETWYPDIFSLSRAKRIWISAAGILSDFMTIAIAYFALFAYMHLSSQEAVIIEVFIRQIILLEWLTILWQFFFFMKTDLYFVIKELLGIENLYSIAVKRIRSWFYNAQCAERYPANDERVITLYEVFFIIGTFLALIRYVLYNLPITLWLLSGGVIDILIGVSRGDLVTALDGYMVTGLELLFLFLLVQTYWKPRFLPSIFRRKIF
ncbi:hypothetical protein A2Z00_04790 [Candidatus Gottesmanbacteria bacterium RBG_13_45_10]|uniref:Uncharacterized protein n=1 Tax=Candidatus Gottesmanbacteria bacterium RBG_13_45_10 TaxID=1798370 RepID=A0A1F5ZG49_9BACT|nr:MAG: hypothetical protein A2Z00_04790 [Candidatus Gottesmanbacteria bacterium RBG_13_45_10]